MLNFLATNDSIAMDVVRSISATFDRAIYNIISLVYNIIIQISNIQIFDNTTLEQFSGRIYTLIGIFMLFKLSFSVITYVINPDSMVDKEKGGAKLLKNIVITFVLILIMPTLFGYLGRAQSAIINEGLIENFIFGADENNNKFNFKMDESCSGVKIDSEGDYMALVIFRPFFQLDPNGETVNSLKQGTYCYATKVEHLLNVNIYNSPTSNSLGNATTGTYDVDYWFIISTLVGGAVALILVGFAMDVAVRAIKLSFLQLISPIPIMSYIDPNQSKNGMLIKWAKEVGKTWASLFIKLIGLHFVIYVITLINSKDEILAGVDNPIWVSILIIVGGLIFVKQLPTLIGNILGIKLDGGFNINPLKKFEKEALGAKTVAAAGGMLRGTVGGAIAGFKAGKNVNNIGKGVAAGILSGASYGRQNPKGAFNKSMDNAYKTLTGNEMAKFNFTKVMMGGGKEEVGEMKGYLKTANEDLRAEETKLGIASHTSAQMGTNLRSRGIDLNNLDAARSTLSAQSDNLLNARNSAKELYTNSQNALANYQTKYSEAENYIKNYQPTAFYDDGSPILSSEYKEYQKFMQDYESNKRTLENNLEMSKQNYQRAENDYKDNTDALKEIDTYLKAVADEKTIRANIQNINKTISTLSDEKKQRERFYHYDSSPKEDVNKAIEKTKTHDYK